MNQVFFLAHFGCFSTWCTSLDCSGSLSRGAQTLHHRRVEPKTTPSHLPPFYPAHCATAPGGRGCFQILRADRGLRKQTERGPRLCFQVCLADMKHICGTSVQSPIQCCTSQLEIPWSSGTLSCRVKVGQLKGVISHGTQSRF